MTYLTPTKDEFFGFDLFFRVERRTGGAVVIVSFRREGKILFEARPVGGKAVRDLINDLLPTLPNGKGFLMALPQKTLSRILNEWIGLGAPESRERRKNTEELTLGVVLLADYEKLLFGSGEKRKEESIKDDQRTIGRLLEHFGSQPWREVTPVFCTPWLGGQSQRAKKDCRRVMMAFERLQLKAGVLDELTWEHYAPKDIRRHRKSQKSAVKAQVEPVMLTDGQCAAILRKIRERIENGKVNGIDMAILLALSAAVDLAYISALDLTDFRFLKDFKERLTARIERKVVKAETNYISCEIEDSYERRTVPLPSIAAKVYRALLAKNSDLDCPLVGDPNNNQRRLNPEKLKLAMAAFLSDVKLIRTTDVPGIRLPAVVDILTTTGLNELENAGLEAEELRVLRGKRPLLVSAKHYYDRCNEAALNKIGAVQDRWLQRLRLDKESTRSSTTVAIKAEGDSAAWIAQREELATQVWVEIDIQPVSLERIPKDGIWLELTAPHGFTGSIAKLDGEKK